MQNLVVKEERCVKCGHNVPKLAACGIPCPVCGWKYPHGDCSEA